MKRVLGAIIIGVGAFALVTGILAVTWVSSAVKKTPLDTDSVTRLSGTATVGEYTGPVTATSITLADTSASSNDVVVYSSSGCLIQNPDGTGPDCVAAEDPSGVLISASTEVFGTDRRTAMGVSDASKLPVSATPKSGLVNKWPFGAKKEDYPYWDSVTGTEITATYQGESEIDGLKVQEYEAQVSDAPIEITAGVAGTYSSTKTIWIEPVTGSIIKQAEVQTRTTTDGDPVLDLDYEFTQETVDGNVSSARDSVDRLTLITRTVPLVAIPAGIVLLVGGFFLHRAGRRDAAPKY